ncbi:MAG: hypothetical protein EPO11_11130 [Gammaproteobacteria bacterium]|nr:MAG: hypothetical protein EPO11_11130 [Gammaproteobacteria bacterium]
MKKSLVSLTLISLVSANSFALELYKAKVISHKEWTTGDIKASFNPGKSNMSKLKNKTSSTNTDSTYADVEAATTFTMGQVGAMVNLAGRHQMYVSNNTQSTQKYFYQFTLCANVSDNLQQCANYYDVLEIEAGGYAYASIEPELQLIFSKAGNYPVYASTYLASEDSSLQDGANSTSVIQIS